MSNWLQDDKSQGNKRARSKGNNYSEIITSAESPDKIQLCLANIVEIQRSMAKQAKQVKELEQQVKELERKKLLPLCVPTGDIINL